MANVRVFVIYYSTYGHVRTLAEAMKKGVDSVAGVKGELYQVAETLPKELLEKIKAPPKADHPVINPMSLPDADGFAFGFPTRFGMMSSQMKAFFDGTGGLWAKQALANKPAGMFTSTGTQGGGQEVTLLTAVTQLAHHGMLYVPAGYAAGPIMFGTEQAKGGSPYGAGTLAGADGSRSPSPEEIEAAVVQGKNLAAIAKKLKA